MISIVSDFVALFSHNIGLNTITFDNLDDDKSDYCDPETFSYLRLMDWYNRFIQRKASKKK